VVAKAGVTLALGLDVEQVDPLDAELWALVLHGSEHCWLDRQPESERGRLAKLIFSVKECAFKCQYPLFGEGWEFEDLVVKFDDREWFEVHVRKTPRTGRLAGAKLGGRYRISGEQIITAMVFAEDTVK
jgi:4'-phosphopantetheinyl transferase EntD